MTMTDRSMSPAQERLIVHLRAERGITDTALPTSMAAAHGLIEQLFAIPRPAPDRGPDAFVPVDKQYFLHDGAVYRTQQSKSGGHVYARRLMLPMAGSGARARWDYEPGVIYRLAENELLTIEQAARLGHLHGFCVVCGRRLDDPESVQRGIGPVCYKRLPH